MNQGSFSLTQADLSPKAGFLGNPATLFPVGIVAAQLLFPKAVPLFVIGWVIHTLLRGFKQKSFGFSERYNPFVLVPFCFWMLHGLSLLYSTDKGFGLKDLETKMAFLILPALFFASAHSLNKSFFKRAYLLLTTIAMLLCWLLSANDFSNELYARANNIPLEEYPYTNYFFSSRLSHFLHPGYFSMFLLMALVFLFDEIKNKPSRNILIACIVLMVFFLLSIIFLASKSGIIALFLMSLWLIFLGKNFSARIKATMAVALVLLFILGSQLPWVKNSFLDALGSVENPHARLQEEKSSSLRMISWRSALKVWQAHPLLGSGAGDIKNELIHQYQTDGNLLSAEKKLNAHSQVLQSMAALGLPGLLLILAMLLLPFFIRMPSGNLLGILLLIFGITESIFETQAGVIFYAVLMPFICMADRSNHQERRK